MATRRSAACVILSAAVLAVVGAVWLAAGQGSRADLAGAAVVATTIPATATSTAPGDDPVDAAGATAPSGPAIEVPPPLVGLPQRLSIPSIGVDAPVVGVGLEADGSMEIPGATEAGWYRPGRRPGAPAGSAVIAAHVDTDDRRGVFFDLRRLEIGSEVAVTGDDGSARRFVVTERFQVGKGDLPVGELFRTEGAPVLTLITCGGAFDDDDRRYEDNIVVRAAPI